MREFTRESLTKNKVRYREVWSEDVAEAIGLLYVSKNLLAILTAEDGGHYPERLVLTLEESAVETPTVVLQNVSLSQEAPRDNGPRD